MIHCIIMIIVWVRTLNAHSSNVSFGFTTDYNLNQSLFNYFTNSNIDSINDLNLSTKSLNIGIKIPLESHVSAQNISTMTQLNSSFLDNYSFPMFKIVNIKIVNLKKLNKLLNIILVLLLIILVGFSLGLAMTLKNMKSEKKS